MQEFLVYLKVGFHHLLNGLDHLAFLVALCAVYSGKNWKKLVALVTAFTLGHCTTLFLVSMNWVALSHKIIEPIIPITILLTALYNIFAYKKDTENNQIRYLMALVFGLIHGLAFGNDFKTLQGESFVVQLFAFNVGLEIAQLLVVTALLLCTETVIRLKISFKLWKNSISVVAGLIAILMMYQRFQ